MRLRIGICLALLISICACSSTPTVRMLNERADYEFDDQMKLNLGTADGPVWSGEKTTVCYIHPHGTPDGGWFHGGYISVKYGDSQWVMPENQDLKPAPKPARKAGKDSMSGKK